MYYSMLAYQETPDEYFREEREFLTLLPRGMLRIGLTVGTSLNSMVGLDIGR